MANILRNMLKLNQLEVISKMEEKNETERCLHFQRLYDYYINDEDEIINYTKKAMLRTFKRDTLEQMQFPYYNIVRRIINRASLAYKLPAERYIALPQIPDGDGVKDDPKAMPSYDNYQELLNNSNINVQSKIWHRLAKLCDTVYIHPVFRTDHMEYDIFPPHLISIVESDEDYLLPKQIAFKKTGRDGEEYTYVWTDEEHFVLDKDNKRRNDLNEWGGVNKYGILPFIPLRLRETENHWGEGDTQLVDVNEKINILLASNYYNAIMQAHGQLVGINTKLKGQIKLGPDSIIQIEGVPDLTSDVKYIYPNPSIETVRAQIEWMVKTAAMTRGLPASAVATDATAMSGASKEIDNWELLEAREDDIEFLRPFEKKLFELSRIIWNFHSPKKIDTKYGFIIDFEEPRFPVSEKEDLENKEKKLKFGTWTPVDDLIDEDEGIDEAKAISIWQKNLELRNQMNDEYGIMQAFKSTEVTPEATDNQ